MFRSYLFLLFVLTTTGGTFAFGESGVRKSVVSVAYPNDVSEVKPTTGKITDARRMIVPAGEFADGGPEETTITLVVKRLGCFDVVAPLTFAQRDAENRTVDVYVSAINVVSMRSAQVDCQQNLDETRSLVLKGGFDVRDIRVHFLK